MKPGKLGLFGKPVAGGQKIHMAESGFEGILFHGDGGKDKAVIVMSGSNGGMKITKTEAEFYSSNGIPALALALFRTGETGKNLDRIPVEYVENAIAFLKGAGYKKIGIDGTSKGSELALLAASMFSDISLVVARVPSHFVSEGLVAEGKSKRPSGTSCWSYRGEEIPFAPYKARKFDIFGMLKKERELHIITFNREKDVTKESLIPIEKINAPILFISSVNDSVWPSCESAAYMADHLERSGFAYPVKHIAFRYMSHAAVTKLPSVYRLAFKAERRNPGECRAEREEMRRELLDFVRKWGLGGENGKH